MNSSILMFVFVHICWFSLSVCIETVCIESERETLLKLKHHLIDPSNRLSSWNVSINRNCCQWDGVVCNNVTSHVEGLDLSTSHSPCWRVQPLNYLDSNKKYVSGMQIPSQSGNLSNLLYLHFQHYFFNDVFIEDIETLT